MSLGGLTPPEIITTEHQVDEFESGEKTLDDWLKKRALKNSITGASRCFGSVWIKR